MKQFGVRYGGRSRQIGLCEPEGANPAGDPALVQISDPTAFLWGTKGRRSMKLGVICRFLLE